MGNQEYHDTIKKAKEELSSNDSLADYLRFYKDLQKLKNDENDVDSNKKVKIAIIGSSTLDGIKEVLDVKCRLLGLHSSVYAAPYNQYHQEILNDNSLLYKFYPDLIIVWINIDVLLYENFYFPYRLQSDKRRSIIEDCFKNVISLIEKLTNKTGAKIVVHNFKTPYNSFMGILEGKQEYGIIEAISYLNLKLLRHYQSNDQVFIFDFDGFMNKYGKDNVEDAKMRYSADMRIKPDMIPKLCECYMGYVKPIKSLSKKCLVLDLDNTLWGGVVGEDGFEGIKLGPKSPGNAFVEFQKGILNLYEKGIILAINSKNNHDDALKVIKEHPYMVLRENHFAAMRINWQDKATNMKEIAEELNIGMNSLVFLDDDKTNRALIRELLPEVLTIDLPEDPALYAQTLIDLNDFNILQLTDEDKKRGEMYVQQRKRLEIQKTSTDLKDFLKNLELKVIISKANKFSIPRISQLTQKTNQFNMTTKRYLEEDINKFSEGTSHLVFSANVEDKFGDYGLTGVAIIKRGKGEWLIDTLLLSCRVLGKEIEKSLLAFIVEEAKKDGVQKLVGEFITTEKNAPAKRFYSDNGFELMKEEGKKSVWNLDISKKEFNYPEFIKVIQEG